MPLIKSIVAGSIILVGATLAARAQPLQPTPYPYAWFFGPYQYAYTHTAPIPGITTRTRAAWDPVRNDYRVTCRAATRFLQVSASRASGRVDESHGYQGGLAVMKEAVTLEIFTDYV